MEMQQAHYDVWHTEEEGEPPAAPLLAPTAVLVADIQFPPLVGLDEPKLLEEHKFGTLKQMRKAKTAKVPASPQKVTKKDVDMKPHIETKQEFDDKKMEEPIKPQDHVVATTLFQIEQTPEVFHYFKGRMYEHLPSACLQQNQRLFALHQHIMQMDFTLIVNGALFNEGVEDQVYEQLLYIERALLKIQLVSAPKPVRKLEYLCWSFLFVFVSVATWIIHTTLATGTWPS